MFCPRASSTQAVSNCASSLSRLEQANYIHSLASTTSSNLGVGGGGCTCYNLIACGCHVDVMIINPLGAGCIYICTKVPYPSPRDAYIYAHLTYFTFACLPTYFAYCRVFCCSHQLLRASHFTHYSITYNGRV